MKFYSKMDIENFNAGEFRTIISAGARYLLEMNILPNVPFVGASGCFMIGLVTGADGWVLAHQTFIDDIIEVEWRSFATKVNRMGFVHSRIVDEVDATNKIKREIIARGILDNESFKAIVMRCPYEQTTYELYNNPHIPR